MLGAREDRLVRRVKSLKSRMDKVGKGLETPSLLKRGDVPRQKCLADLRKIRDEIDDILKEQDRVWIL